MAVAFQWLKRKARNALLAPIFDRNHDRRAPLTKPEGFVAVFRNGIA
jgi:hypothetical protein